MSDDPYSSGVQALLGLGVKPEVAKGAVNYMYRNESGLNPYAVNPTSGAYGYGQWLGPRKEALFSQYGPNPTGEQQWQHMVSELQGSERTTLNKLLSASGEKAGYDIWGQSYERPGAQALSKAGAYPEGYYGGALHVNISKEQRADNAADSLLSQMLLNSMAPRIRGEEKKGEGGLLAEAPPEAPIQEPPQQAQAEPQQQELIQLPPPQPSPQLGAADMPPLQPLPQAGGPLPAPLEVSPPPSAAPQQPQQQAQGTEDILKNLLRQAIPGTGQAQQEAAASPITSDPLLSRILRQVSPVGTAQAAEPVAPSAAPAGPASGPPAAEPPTEAQPQIMGEPGAPGIATPLVPEAGRIAGEYIRRTPERVMGGIEDVNKAFREGNLEDLAGRFAVPGVTRVTPPRPGIAPPPPGTLAPRVAEQNRQGIERVADGIRDLFWSKDWLERRTGRTQAKATIRQERGTAEQAKTSAVAKLEEFRPEGARMGEEFREWIANGKAGPPPQAMQLINDIEGVQALPAGHPLEPMADALRRIYRKTRSDMEASLPDMEDFVQNYYRHMWAETAQGQGPGLATAAKTGSSASTKQRTVPTIGEGLDRGLTPVHFDPVENTLHYISGIQDYMAFKRAMTAGTEMGYVTSNPLPGRGFVPLKNRGGAVQYAEPGFAKIWNYHYGEGWNLPGYQTLLRAANTVTAMKLGMSGYHAWNIAQEAAVAGIASGIGRITKGEIAKGLKDMGFSATVIPKLVEDVARGRKLQRVYLDLDTGTNMDRHLVDLFAKAGGRAVGRGTEYHASAMDNFFQAFKRGKLKADAREHARRIMGDPATEGTARRVGAAPFRTMAVIANELSRIAQTISAPLFDTVIPKVKLAAWADEMEAFLIKRPNATHEEQLAEARRLVDTMDDRFGEMVQDNLFWPPLLRKLFNLTATSIGWEFGSLRAYAGAAKDLMAGRPLSPRGRWSVAFPTIAAISGAVYQYLKTGKAPGQDEQGRLVPGGALKDLAFPRSGGTTPEGMPELALLPGYEKDPIQWYKHLEGAYDYTKDGDMENAVLSAVEGAKSWVVGRANPFWQMAHGLTSKKDFYGRQISDTFYADFLGPYRGVAGFILESYLPIPATTQEYRGSNIGTAERILGVRPAPQVVQDPATDKMIKEKMRMKELQKEYYQLFSFGRRTTKPEAELKRQGEVLRDEMRKLADKMRQTQKEINATPRQRPSRAPLTPPVQSPSFPWLPSPP